MHMKRWLAPFLFLVTSLHAETVALTLRVDTAPIAEKDSALQFKSVEPVKAETKTLQVRLAPTFIEVRHPDRTTILDFEKRILFEVRSDGATTSSLFSQLGSRDREMENRQYLAELTEKAGGASAIPLAVSEQDLAILARPPAKGVERQAKGGAVRFHWGDVPLGEYSTDSIPANGAEKKAFAQFIRYHFGAHPSMLADLAKGAGIPRRVKLVENVGGRTQQLTVTKLERVDDAPYAAPPNAKYTLASHEVWGPIIQRANALSADDVRKQADELAAAGDASFAAGKLVDAYLLYLESFLMIGEVSDGLRGNAQSMRLDETVARLQAVISPKSEDEAKAALAVLAELRKTNPDRAEVIRIFEANISSNLGDRNTAYENFHAVLTARPALAGVWHDLGGMFLNAYDAEAAWNCWDTLRHLAPQHGMSKEITEREAKMMSLYPEYF
jgi:hypothetical protein